MSHTSTISKNTTTTVKRYPVGIEDYRELVTENFFYVDKSPFIKELIEEGSKVSVITRPRRFGKTLSMSMLEYFFAETVYDNPTQGLFDRSWLAKQHPELIVKHQGQYPVINISLKSVKPNSFEEAMEQMRGVLSRLFFEHEHLLETEALKTEAKQAAFNRILTLQANDDEIKNALLSLSMLLRKVYKKPVIILIDEYDTPIQTAYVKGYYKKLIDFMRGFLGSSLKGNSALYKGVITGITRVARESLFSDLNNAIVCTVLDNKFSSAFGFTETETECLVRQSHLDIPGDGIKNWYNGYRIGDSIIYNPWSIISCLNGNGKLQAYWVNTSSNDLLRTVIAKASGTIKNKLEELIQGHTIDTELDVFTHFDRFESDETALWNLLLSTGYLTAKQVYSQGITANCQIAIPNLEINLMYQGIIRGWFYRQLGTDGYGDFMNSLITGDIDYFFATLKQFLRDSASFFDPAGRHPEKFYHGLILGMLVYLQSSHQVLSNREAGFGRYDVSIIPKDKTQYPLAVIMEFKALYEEDDDLKQAAEQALQQIQQKHYLSAIESAGIPNKLLIGLAFRGKQVAIAYKK